MDTKEVILKGALDMFLRYGVKSITMDDIAKTVGMSKKTLYQFFKDKDMLVDNAVKIYTEFHSITLTSIQVESKNAIDELMKCSDFMKNNVCNINPALLYDVRKYHPKAWITYLDFRNLFIEKTIEATLVRGIGEGYFRQNIDSKILAKLRVEAVEMAFNPEVFNSTDFDIYKVHLALFEHFIFGICTLKGHRLLNKFIQINEED